MDLIKIDEITIWRKRQKYGWGTRSEVRNELIVLCKVVRFSRARPTCVFSQRTSGRPGLCSLHTRLINIRSAENLPQLKSMRTLEVHVFFDILSESDL